MVGRGSKIKLKCPVCQLFLSGKDNLDQHIVLAHSVKTGSETWSCARCLQPFTATKAFIVHIFSCSAPKGSENRVVKATSSAYKCLDCSDAFLTEREIKAHIMETKHSSKFEVIQNIDRCGDYGCFLCPKKFFNQEMCNQHYLHVHMVWVDEQTTTEGPADAIDSPLQMKGIPDRDALTELGFPSKQGHFCHLCDSVIKSYPLFYLHMQDLHHLVKRFRCVVSTCEQTFSSPSAFREHVKCHSQDVSNSCSICDLTFASKDDLKEHNYTMEHGNKYMKMHEKCRPSGIEARNHQCKVCQAWFGLRRFLVDHMESDHHDYKCHRCGLQYLQPGSRRLHIQQAHPEIATMCEFCFAKLQTTQSVWGHLKTHGIVHECEECHRRFLHKEQLITHMETHEPASVCPWRGCGRQLVTKISLYYHLKTHQSDEEHKCRYCQKGFSKQKLLEAHERTHEVEAAESAAKTAAEEVSPQKASSESEMIQLICAGCEKGFDDEDQFAGHACTADEPDMTKEDKSGEDKVATNAEEEIAMDVTESAHDEVTIATNEEQTTADAQQTAVEEDKMETEAMLLDASTPPLLDLPDLDKKGVDSDVLMSDDTTKKERGGQEEKEEERQLDSKDQDEDLLSKDLSLSDPEDCNQEGDAGFVSKDVVVEEEVEKQEGQEVSSATVSDSIISSLEEIAQQADNAAAAEKSETHDNMNNSNEDDCEQQQTVVMMVSGDNVDENSQSVELELPDDGSGYAGATLLKVPTSDGKMLLIPFSSADGTAVLSLPPGLTLDPENSHGSESIQLALEDENGDERRFLHVEGGMEELLQTTTVADDIRTIQEEKTTSSSIADLCNQD